MKFRSSEGKWYETGAIEEFPKGMFIEASDIDKLMSGTVHVWLSGPVKGHLHVSVTETTPPVPSTVRELTGRKVTWHDTPYLLTPVQGERQNVDETKIGTYSFKFHNIAIRQLAEVVKWIEKGEMTLVPV